MSKKADNRIKNQKTKYDENSRTIQQMKELAKDFGTGCIYEVRRAKGWR